MKGCNINTDLTDETGLSIMIKEENREWLI